MSKRNGFGVVWRGVVWRGVEVKIAVDKWDMGWGAMSLGWAGWGSEHAHWLCAPLPLLCCPACEK